MRDYNPSLVELNDVPMRQREGGLWKKRFDELPKDKAIMLKYNNRQRAHQVRNAIRQEARIWKCAIATRIIHAEPAIHNTDGWLLYFWKNK